MPTASWPWKSTAKTPPSTAPPNKSPPTSCSSAKASAAALCAPARPHPCSTSTSPCAARAGSPTTIASSSTAAASRSLPHPKNTSASSSTQTLGPRTAPILHLAHHSRPLLPLITHSTFEPSPTNGHFQLAGARVRHQADIRARGSPEGRRGLAIQPLAG